MSMPPPIKLPDRIQRDHELADFFKQLTQSLYQLWAKSEDLPIFADNASAIAGGLQIGAFYRTGGDPDAVCVVH